MNNNTSELTLKLSDFFEKQEEEPALECKARGININYGFNTDLLTSYRTEVIGMLLTEYDEERHLR